MTQIREQPDLDEAVSGRPLAATFPFGRMRFASLAILALYAFMVVNYKHAYTVFGLTTFIQVLSFGVAMLVVGYIVYTRSHLGSVYLFQRVTGVTYIFNHSSFRDAGGYDVPIATNLAAHLLVFFTYWLLLPLLPDSMKIVRTFWVYVIVLFVVEYALAHVVGTIVFRRFEPTGEEVL